jgi:hypothetical protein
MRCFYFFLSAFAFFGFFASFLCETPFAIRFVLFTKIYSIRYLSVNSHTFTRAGRMILLPLI